MEDVVLIGEKPTKTNEKETKTNEELEKPTTPKEEETDKETIENETKEEKDENDLVSNVSLYLEVQKYVPEVSDYPIEVVNSLWLEIRKVYKEDKDKILAMYYLGYVLTNDESNGGEEIRISNVSLKSGDGQGNKYLSMLKKLLDLRNKDKNTLNKRPRIVLV